VCQRKEKHITEKSLQHLVGAESSTLAEAREQLRRASTSTMKNFYPLKAVRITPLVIEKDQGFATFLEFGTSVFLARR